MAPFIAVLLTLALVAAACGRDDGETESGGETTTTSGSGGGTTDASFGDLDDVCGPGDASGATAQGVTDTEITVGVFSDPGADARPGLNQELFDAADVFAAWCNELGGINGRQIKVNQHDAKLFEYKAAMADACAQDFVMVGGGAVFDDTGTEDRLNCLLVDIAGYVVTPKARGADLLVQPVPNAFDTISAGSYRWLAEEYPEAVTKAGVMAGDLPATKTVAAQNKEAAEAQGWEFVYDDVYPPAGITSWVPYAQGLADKGVKSLIWVGEPENLANLLNALSDIQYELEFVRVDANHYDQKLIDLGGDAVQNVYINSNFYPFEDAEEGSATAKYLDLFEQYKPDGKSRAYLGLQAFSAWLLFAQAAKECGSDLTRKCVYDNARAVTEWTGGGLHSRQTPGSGEASECFSLLLASPDGFEVVDVGGTDDIFACDPENVYTLTGDYGERTTLASVGKSESDLE